MNMKKPLSPERMALAEAIHEVKRVIEEQRATEAALVTARAARSNAAALQAEAEQAVANAKNETVAHLVASASGTAGPAPVTIRQTRQNLIEAEDQVEISRNVVKALEERIRALAGTLNYKREEVRNRATEVLQASASVEALVSEVDRLQRELADKGKALMWMAEQRMLPSSMFEKPGPMLTVTAPTRMALARLYAPPSTWHELLNDRTLPGAKPWVAVVEALMVDPSAPLPPMTS